MRRILARCSELLSALVILAATTVGLLAGLERGGLWIVASPALAFAIAALIVGLVLVASRFTLVATPIGMESRRA